MLTVEKLNGKSILCSAIRSSVLNQWLKAKPVNDVNPLPRKGMMTMSKKKTAQNTTRKPARKSAALNHPAATMTDIGQFFSNSGNMENLMTQTKSQFDKLTNDATNMGREGFDAFNKSLAIFTKGYEEIVRASVSFVQDAAEKQSQLVKEALSSKSLNEWTDVQNRIAQSNFDDAIAAATKLSELSVKILSESAEPINSQFTKSIKKAGEAIAA
jgi:phasin family protein